jgi:hypothetical protein
MSYTITDTSYSLNSANVQINFATRITQLIFLANGNAVITASYESDVSQFSASQVIIIADDPDFTNRVLQEVAIAINATTTMLETDYPPPELRYGAVVTEIITTQNAGFEANGLINPETLSIFVQSRGAYYEWPIAPCFSFSLFSKLKLKNFAIIVKGNRNNKKMYKVGDYELTFDHPISYKGKLMTWEDYALKVGGELLPPSVPEYVYNIIGSPEQLSKDNQFKLTPELTIFGGKLSNSAWQTIFKKTKIINNLLSTDVNYDAHITSNINSIEDLNVDNEMEMILYYK